MVLSGFVTAWRLATVPTRRSPLLLTATTDGVMRPPSLLGMTVGSPASMTATTEFVVPRSMPITLPMPVRLPSGSSRVSVSSQDGKRVTLTLVGHVHVPRFTVELSLKLRHRSGVVGVNRERKSSLAVPKAPEGFNALPVRPRLMKRLLESNFHLVHV